MKVLFKNIETDEVWEGNYPRKDISEPVQGLSKDIEIYYINETKEDLINSLKYKLVKQKDNLSNDNHNEYKHLKLCNRNWIRVEKTKEEVISNLNSTLYNILDREYPLIERIKDSDEMIYGNPDNDKENIIRTKKKWEQDLRTLNRQRIKDYIENDIFPSFEFKLLNK